MTMPVLEPNLDLAMLRSWSWGERLVTTVIVPQLHDPVMLANALATGDMVSGRLTVGIGAGGRHEDYRAVGAEPRRRRCDGGEILEQLGAQAVDLADSIC
jgi:alkanesulfonate monooxygenase SsuD/methylene tetrahydromethanopterin reductase-like flavin-dependent oxidoreductase (luciferase family)